MLSNFYWFVFLYMMVCMGILSVIEWRNEKK